MPKRPTLAGTYSVRGAAAALGMHPQTIYKAIRAGVLKSYRPEPMGQILIKASALSAWRESVEKRISYWRVKS